MQALQEVDPDTLDKFAGLITGRLKRVCGVVEAEMDNYEPDPHTEQCKERAQYLRDKIMPIFTDRVEAIWGAIENGQVSEVDEFMMNEFIEASRMVFDGVHDVRRAVLQIRVSTKEDTSGKACHPALKKSFSTCFFLNFFLFPFSPEKIWPTPPN